jgi:hypothetical protein
MMMRKRLWMWMWMQMQLLSRMGTDFNGLRDGVGWRIVRSKPTQHILMNPGDFPL